MTDYEAPFGPDIDPPLYVDPVLFPVLDRAQEFQSKLDLYPNAPKELRDEMVAELDGLWPRMEAPVLVTGILKTPEIQIDDEYDYENGAVMVEMSTDEGPMKELTVVAAGERCLSQGFHITEEGRITYGDADMGARHVIKLLFTREVELTLPGQEEPIVCDTECIGDIDQLIMDFGNPSDAYAEYIARDYFAEYTSLVDERLNDCDTTAEAILALRDTDIFYEQSFITENEVMALQRHLTEALGIEFESEPYHMKIKEMAVPLEPEAMDVVIEEEEVPLRANELVRVCGLDVQPKVEITFFPDGGGQIRALESFLEVRLVVRLLRRQSAGDTGLIAIRVDDIEDLRNVRDAYHDAFEKIQPE